MNKSVDKLESVKAALEHWRETRTSQGKIPDYLWEQIKALLDAYPLSKICSTLKVCYQKLCDNPFNETIFAFSNKTRTSVKLLIYDASGFWLYQKRFSKGRLAWWPGGTISSVKVRSSELIILLTQGTFAGN